MATRQEGKGISSFGYWMKQSFANRVANWWASIELEKQFTRSFPAGERHCLRLEHE
jgi:hypothetical protein